MSNHVPSVAGENRAAQLRDSPRLWRAPVLRAALIQALAAVPLAAVLWIVLAQSHLRVPLYAVAAAQGIVAALLTRSLGLARWWPPIQLVFPIAVLGTSTLHLPPAALLGPFLILVLLFWSTFRTQVPFYPSGRAVWAAVARLMPSDRSVRLIDIGSGLGGLVLHLERANPSFELSGIEVAPLPWLLSVMRARFTGDYERLDFAQYDVVFAYLSPAAMSALWRKASREMRPATMLISYEFSIPCRAPDRTIAPTALGPSLFVWYF
jgi:hypothetical protein